ncbi:glycoside hydrolase family 28 protein [uncultured Cohaesibacter sp.]|uniref:polygalacturonase PglA n=1 Tax=uncultured Cohaesibacter sp. TaxID=1002546 RepID=UPI0029C8B307|nr:glycoside hydrolase family 28 protein [uncultured Cohaesibacter sp.]
MMTITASAITARTVALCLNPDGKSRFFLPKASAWTLYRNGEIVRSGETDRVITFLDCLDPSTRYVFETDAGEQFAFTTADCAGRIDISDFGARPDSTNNALAIAAALAAVPVGGTLAIPSGCWHTGPLFLKSDMTLHLEPGATLKFITDRDQIPILPPHLSDGKMLGSWEGLPDASYASIITAIGCVNLEITGSGTLDGSGAEGDWWSWPKERRNGARRARTLFLHLCEAVTVSGITVQNSPSWTIHPLYCRDIEFVGLAVKNPPNSPNTDGLDPECCDGVLLEGIHFTVGDDCIAIKACKRADDGAAAHLKPCENITVRHCYMERGHGAVVIGSEMSGSVRHVTIEHCEFLGTDRGLRLKTRRGRGGEIAHVRCHNIVMRDVHSAIVANCFYFCDHDGRSEWVQSRQPYPVDASTPSIHDIDISDLFIHDVRVAIGAFYGLPEMPIRAISIKNVHASFDDSLEGDVPVMALQVPVCHHVGFTTEFAELHFHDGHEFFPLSSEQEQAETC